MNRKKKSLVRLGTSAALAAIMLLFAAFLIRPEWSDEVFLLVLLLQVWLTLMLWMSIYIIGEIMETMEEAENIDG